MFVLFLLVAGSLEGVPESADPFVHEVGAWYASGSKEGAYERLKDRMRKVCPDASSMSECTHLVQSPASVLLAARLKRDLGAPHEAAGLLAKHIGKWVEDPPWRQVLHPLLVIEKARALKESGNPGKGASVLWNLRKNRQSFFWWEAVRLQADYLSEAGRNDLAAGAFSELAARSLHAELRAYFRYRAGKSFHLAGKPAQAEKALKLSAVHDASSTWNAKVLEALEEYGGGVDLNVKERYLRAGGLFDGFHMETAARAYRELLETPEEDLSKAKGKRKSYLDARRNEVIYGLARSLLFAGDYNEGLKYVRLLPDDASWRNKAGRLRRSIKRRLGKFKEVGDDLVRQGERVSEPSGRRYNFLAAADAFMHAGSYKKSLDLLQKSAPSAKSAALRFREAYLLLKTGETEKACSAFEKVSSLRGRRNSGRYWLGVCNLRLGRKDEAMERFFELAGRKQLCYYGLLARARLKEMGKAETPETSPLARFAPSLDNPPLRAIKHLSRIECRTALTCLLKRTAELSRIGFKRETRSQLRRIVSCVNKDPSSRSNLRPFSQEHYWIGVTCPPFKDGGRGAENLPRETLSSLADISAWAGEESIARLLNRALNRPLEPTPRPLERYITENASNWGVRPSWVWAVIRVESAYNPMVISTAGARGFMQLMPHTARRVAERLDLESFDMSMLFEEEPNVEFGSWYLGQLLTRFKNQLPLALAGYNGGPHNVAVWLRIKGDLPLDEFIEEIPFTETRRYVKKTLRWIYRYSLENGDEPADLISLKVNPAQEDNIDF